MLDIRRSYRYLKRVPNVSSNVELWESQTGWTFRATLTNTGHSESTIKISYREFFEGRAREAFYLDLEYTLEDEGITVIDYRGIQIEVIEVGNNQITFRVLDDNGLDWLPHSLNPFS